MRRWPGVIFNQRSDMSFHYASPRLEELTGVPLSEFLQRSDVFWNAIHEGDLAGVQSHIRRALRSEGGLSAHFRIRHARTGRVAYILEHRQALRTDGGLLLGFEGNWMDVSRQTIAERRLSSTARRDTIATLTMGMAHDFGNILAGIHALAETLEPAEIADDPLHESLGLIKRNALQASALVRRVLSLHQGRLGECGYHDLNQQVSDLLELVRKTLPRRIRFESGLTPKALPVYVDSVELRQVFLNLIMNASDAMPHNGHLWCTTHRITEPESPAHLQGTFPRLPAICVAVRDNGVGIPERHLGTIFDPFFTTKPVNRGSGLGLYNARLFVEKHHGAISVESVEGQGTTFRIWLPEADFSEQERVHEDEERRRRTLLVVGPAGRSLDTTVDTLRRAGLFVVTENREDQALGALESMDYEFNGVLVQVAADAPERIGRLLREVRQRRPPVRSILQIIGRNEDEIPVDWLKDAHLTLPSDLQETEIQSRLKDLFDHPPGR